MNLYILSLKVKLEWLLQFLKELWLEDSFYPRINKTDNCWIWIGPKNKEKGYGVITIPRGKGSTIGAHRFSYCLFNNKLDSIISPTLNNNISVCHKCDNKVCVNPNHLYEGTDKDNWNDMVTRNNYSKDFTHKTIVEVSNKSEIKWLYREIGLTQRKIADMFGFKQCGISNFIAKNGI
jgi:hypothetical protein